VYSHFRILISTEVTLGDFKLPHPTRTGFAKRVLISSSSNKGSKRLAAGPISVVIRFGFFLNYPVRIPNGEAGSSPYAGMVPIAKLKTFAVAQCFMKH
jgi:hypothetical protein